MVSILLGVAIAAYGEARFDVWGAILRLGAVAFEATRVVLSQILQTSQGVQLNPITSLYYVASCCLVSLSVALLFVEFPILREKSGFHFDFRDTVTPVNLIGHTAAFIDGACYNNSKLQALEAKDLQKAFHVHEEESGKLLKLEGKSIGKKGESQD
ncbi:hypothetical protein Nepgr_014290 [Nepenthes gracilis]|uniref:Uncharacterized protein n=1 Tax=Nepenthes gracilis TaxID=150966 RepID=A0AAD3XQ02_NEPGR|nr:hypothetical protein Nepgr_014290 [Nepenthes gracilis]